MYCEMSTTVNLVSISHPTELQVYFFYLVFYLAALGLSCGIQDLSLWHPGSPAVACGFSCPTVCRILPAQPGIEPVCHTLQGRFLTTGPLRKSLFLSDENFKNILSQHLSNIQSSIINCSHHAVHHIPRTYLSYNWRCVPLTTFTSLPNPGQPPPLAVTSLFSVFILFLDSIQKQYYIEGICLSLSDLFHLSVMPSRSIHVIANNRISLFFFLMAIPSFSVSVFVSFRQMPRSGIA